MALNDETRRTGTCGRASEMSFGRDSSEYSPAIILQQAAWLTARYHRGAAHARVVAEHAFARRPAR
jgi:hypothetical protein